MGRGRKMSGRTEPDWNRWDPSLGRVQALPRMALLPMQGSTPDVRFELPGATGTLETTFLLVGATGFEPATFRPPAERTHPSCVSERPYFPMCPRPWTIWTDRTVHRVPKRYHGARLTIRHAGRASPP